MKPDDRIRLLHIAEALEAAIGSSQDGSAMTWNDVLRRTLGPAERGLVGEIRGHRNRWAHQEPFTSDDADRALDSIARLLTAVSAPQAEDFARYVYLPRLRDPEVLVSAVRDGLGLLLWQQESFAFADGYDDASGWYRGLRCGQRVDTVEHSGEGLLVKPEVAIKH